MSQMPEPDPGAFEMASMKRQIATLQEEIDRSHGAKKKTSYVCLLLLYSSEYYSCNLRHEQSLARGASRLVSMFEPIHVLVAEFDRRLAATVSGATNAETDPSVIRE